MTDFEKLLAEDNWSSGERIIGISHAETRVHANGGVADRVSLVGWGELFEEPARIVKCLFCEFTWLNGMDREDTAHDCPGPVDPKPVNL